MKVMVSFPDDLLARIDAGAAERGESRSAFLQEAARMRLGDVDEATLEAIEWMQKTFADVDAPSAADLIREDRDSR